MCSPTPIERNSSLSQHFRNRKRVDGLRFAQKSGVRKRLRRGERELALMLIESLEPVKTARCRRGESTPPLRNRAVKAAVERTPEHHGAELIPSTEPVKPGAEQPLAERLLAPENNFDTAFTQRLDAEARNSGIRIPAADNNGSNTRAMLSRLEGNGPPS